MIYYCSKFYHLELWWMGKSTDRREMFTIPHFISFVQYNIFNFSLLYFDIKKTLITKSVKNHSFLLSLNWTVSGIYGDQCCSLIEILSPWFFYLSQTYTSHISFLTTIQGCWWYLLKKHTISIGFYWKTYHFNSFRYL